MKRLLVVLIVLIGFLSSAFAQNSRPSQAMCDRAKLAARAYFDCLEAGVRKSDEALNDAVSKVRAMIDGRPELAQVQKARWKNAFNEAHSAWAHFRNLECQNVAPFEGSKGIGAFDERLACLIDKSTIRAQELLGRYGRQ